MSGNAYNTIFYQNIGSYITTINKYLSNIIPTSRLGKYIKITGGYSFKSDCYQSSGIPVIRISDFQNERVVLDNVKFYKEDPSFRNYELKSGDIIIALTGGTIGKLAIVQDGLGKLYQNQRVGKFEIIDKNNFEKDYVYWLARGVQDQVKNLAWGASQPNVSGKTIEEMAFPIPDRNIQKKIINFLQDLSTNSIVDGREYFDYHCEELIKKTNKNSLKLYQIINNSENQKNYLKNLRKQILQDAVEGKLTKEWREKNPDVESASELLKKIKREKEKLVSEKKIKKEKTLPPIEKNEVPFELPSSWIWTRIGEITNYGSSEKIEPNRITDDTWVLDLEDIEKESSKIINFETFKNRNTTSSKSVFKKGDVLYSKLRPYLDKVVVAPGDGICTTEIIPIKMFAELNPLFFMYNLKRRDFLDYASRCVKGMKMPRFGTEDVKLSYFPLPPLSEQLAIVSKLQTSMQKLDEAEKQIENSLETSKLLTKVILAEAFKGE